MSSGEPDMREPLPARAVLIHGGTIYDLLNDRTYEADILVRDGKIAKIGRLGRAGFTGTVVDATGCVVAPGLLDMHVHLREPGREDKETIATGCAAAMVGGFTAVCAMPNTDPPADKRAVIEFIKERARGQLTRVYPIATITAERKGAIISEMADLVEAGAVAFSDDGDAVKNTAVLRRALEYSSMFNVPIIEHCEDPYLDAGGVMNEGFVSTELGLPGMPAIAEEIIVERDLSVLRYVGGRLHIAHISTARSVDLVRQAKDEGLAVTCEVTPHHLTLTEEEMRRFDANYKMNPPLRTAEDVEALHQGLRDGTIDAIASDHAPHAVQEKEEVELAVAPFGVIGLETTLGVIMKGVVERGTLSLLEALRRLTIGPARILNLQDTMRIEEGVLANLTVFDPNASWQIDPAAFRSKARNTPFKGWNVKGQVKAVLNNGLWYGRSQ